MRRFFGSLSAVYLVNIVNGLLGVAFVPIALRRLGPSGYGVYSLYAVLAGYVVLVELGLGKNLLRLLAGERDPERRREQFRLAFGVYLAISAVLLVALPALAYLVPSVVFPMPPEHRAALGWITVLTAVEYVVGVPVSMMQTRCVADEEFRRYSRFSLASGLLRYALSFLAVLLFDRPEQVVALIVTRRVADVGLARALLGPLPAGAWRPSFDRRAMRAMVAHSSMLSVAQLLQLTMVSLGAILVNGAFGVRALGVYRAVFDLASKVWFFSNAIGMVIFPRFVRLLASPEKRVRLRALLPSVLETSWLGYAALAVATAVVGPLVLARVGMGGLEYTALFVLVAAGMCFNAHSTLAIEFLQATGAYRRVIGLAALSLAVLASVFLLLRTSTPALAVGWAWLASQVAYSLRSDRAVERLLEVPGVVAWRGLRSRAGGVLVVISALGAWLALAGAPRLLGLAGCAIALVGWFAWRARAVTPLLRAY